MRICSDACRAKPPQKRLRPYPVDEAFVPPMRRADDRVTVNPHVLLQPVSASRLSGAARITVRRLSPARQ